MSIYSDREFRREFKRDILSDVRKEASEIRKREERDEKIREEERNEKVREEECNERAREEEFYQKTTKVREEERKEREDRAKKIREEEPLSDARRVSNLSSALVVAASTVGFGYVAYGWDKDSAKIRCRKLVTTIAALATWVVW